MLVTSERCPKTCKLFSLKKSTVDERDRNFLVFQRQIPLPETAASNKTIFTGTSLNGFVFTTRTNHTDIFAVNPLNGLHLPPPPSVAFLSFSTIPKPWLSLLTASSSSVVSTLTTARVGDECWTSLPDDFTYMQDFIFLKGPLYVVDHRHNIAIFDFNNPSSLTVSGGAAPHMPRHAIIPCAAIG